MRQYRRKISQLSLFLTIFNLNHPHRGKCLPTHFVICITLRLLALFQTVSLHSILNNKLSLRLTSANGSMLKVLMLIQGDEISIFYLAQKTLISSSNFLRILKFNAKTLSTLTCLIELSSSLLLSLMMILILPFQTSQSLLIEL